MADFEMRFKDVAEANFFEIDVAETLRAYPMGLPSRVLLEVQPLPDDTENFKLIQHRQPEWTARYANRKVSASWIEDFLRANRGVAWFIAEVEAIQNRAKAGPKANIGYDEIRSKELEDQRRRVHEERVKREATILEANARIIAANIAAGLDQVEDGSRPVSYYEYFLTSTVQSRHVRGRGGPTRK